MKSKTIRTYFISLGAVLLASAYPIYMGVVMLIAYVQNGGVNATEYPKYVIPYTPICIALILCVALLPLLCKLCKRFTLPAVSVLALLLFFGAEFTFEKVTVFSESKPIQIVTPEELAAIRDEEWTPDTIETWQWAMCAFRPIVTDQILISPQTSLQEPIPLSDAITIPQEPTARILKNPLITEYGPVFKLHFYMISVIIIVSVLSVVYGFYQTSRDRNYKKRKPLITQFIFVLVFIGLCVFACFTAFFRMGEILVSPISALLMAVFFLLFGIIVGVYTGTLLYGRRKLFSVLIPSIAASIVTVFMYIGEMVMMGWNLYRFGVGFLFNPIGACPLALIDFLIIALLGVITYWILFLIRQREENG